MRHVKERAALVNSTAEGFSLSHAVMALRRIIEAENENRCSLALQELKKRIKEDPKFDNATYEKLKKGIFNLDHKRVFIVVDYLDKYHLTGSRTITSDGDYIEIILPYYLQDDVEKLRKTLGHELGHLALHLDELYENSVKSPLQGSILIKDPAKEKEADVFADELSALRAEHLKATLCSECDKGKNLRPML